MIVCSTAGAALAEARRAKESTYPEFAGARPCPLVVLGRWDVSKATFPRLLV